MKRWSVCYPLLALVVCLLATLLAAGCIESKSEDGGGVVDEEEAGSLEVLGALEQEDANDLALIAIGNRSKFKAVDMTYNGLNDNCADEWAGNTCVSVHPENASIWKDKDEFKGKPKKVKWWIDDAQKGMYYWEIAYKGANPADDWLGAIPPIDCGSKKTKSGPVGNNVKPGADLTWPYRITVWTCDDDGEKDPNGCLCKTDPLIEIWD